MIIDTSNGLHIRGIFHPLGWGCGWDRDTFPITPAGEWETEVMHYKGIFESLDNLPFKPKNGDIVQIVKDGKMAQYVFSDEELKWMPFGGSPEIYVGGKGITISGENVISVQDEDDDDSITVDENNNLTAVWSVFNNENGNTVE